MAGRHSRSIEKLRALREKEIDPAVLAEEIIRGNVNALSKAITLIESHHPGDRKKAADLLDLLLPKTGNSIRIAVSGVPGSGKSSFIESFGNLLTSLGKKVAVLAIDPSSESSKGSILGDKTRMTSLASNPHAFVRPSPSSGTLGGVAEKTRETIFLCEAAGYEIVLIETVGVGQSEIEAHSMVDFFILILLTGAGDELQGIKRGIMEMADLVLVNKADGANLEKAKIACQEISRALHLLPGHSSGWEPLAMTCSAYENKGISEAWDQVIKYISLVKSNGHFDINRKEQSGKWLHESIRQQIINRFYENPQIKEQLALMEEKVKNNKISLRKALSELLEVYFGKGFNN